MANQIKKTTQRLGDRISDLVYWFFGSWWSVIIHAVWFSIWLLFGLNIHTLTLVVSLEAIYIGVFILMATDRAERQRSLRELRQRERDRKRAEYDIKLDEKADRQLTEIKRLQKEIRAEVEAMKERLNKVEGQLQRSI